MKNKSLLGTFQLLIAAFIWGSAFVAQSEGMNHVGPLTFLSVRFILGGTILLPVILLRSSLLKHKTQLSNKARLPFNKLLVGGLSCGILLTVASGLQQFGLLYTSVGKAGFITTLYVIFVPLFTLFLGKRLSINLWVAVLLATAGLYLLCMTEGFYLSLGDTLVFLCAVCYTGHIIAVEKYSEIIDPIVLSAFQFFTVGIIAGILALIFEEPSITAIISARISILYAGVLSSGVAFTLQVVAQRYTEPTIAAITMSFESVFAVLSGWIILQERLTLRQIFGCLIMFCAIILAQIPAEIFKKARSHKLNPPQH